jgi:hypothetical protein
MVCRKAQILILHIFPYTYGMQAYSSATFMLTWIQAYVQYFHHFAPIITCLLTFTFQSFCHKLRDQL